MRIRIYRDVFDGVAFEYESTFIKFATDNEMPSSESIPLMQKLYKDHHAHIGGGAAQGYMLYAVLDSMGVVAT